MTDNIENLVLEHLRAIRTDMGSMKDDVREIKSRVNTLEAGQATIIQQIGHLLVWPPNNTLDTTDCWNG
jgi:hypothetical protein